jgi:hypothetical protein
MGWLKNSWISRNAFILTAIIGFPLCSPSLRAAPVEVVKTIRQDGTGDFTSLAAWIAAKGGVPSGNLVAANVIAVARIEGEWTSPDTTPVVLSGFTTDPSCYVRIYTTPQARHNGTAGSGYRSVSASNFHIGITHARIEGLEIHCTGATTALYTRTNTGPGIGDIRISHNLIHGDGISTTYGIQFYAYAGAVRISNNLLYDLGDVGYSSAIGLGDGVNYVHNNTIAGTIDGIGIRSSSSTTSRAYARNNLIISTGPCFYGVFNSGSDYNACSGTISSGGPHDRTGVTFTFVNAAGRNYHLASTDTGARDQGMNLQNDPELPIQDDMDGQSRYGVRDIGADEYFTGIPSDTASPTIPGTPVGSLSSGGVDLVWSASVDNIVVAGYRIYRNGLVLATAASNTFRDETVLPLTDYTYRVAAYDAAGNESAASGPALITTPIPTPSSGPWIIQVRALSRWPSPAEITWTTSDPATSQVEYGSTATYGTTTARSNTLTVSHSITLPNLPDNSTWHYRVRSVDAYGNETISADHVFNISSALDKVYYVSGSSGADTNPGTEALPWKTLQYAANTVQPGDTVIVKPGSYERFQVTRGGSPGHPITFKGESLPDKSHVNFTALFDPARPAAFPGNPLRNAVCRGFSVNPNYGSTTPIRYVRFENFEITAVSAPGKAFLGRGAVHLAGRNDTGTPVPVEHIEVINNFLHDTNAEGYNYIAIRGDTHETHNILVRGNTIFRCQGTGIGIQGSNWLVESNDVSHTLDANTDTGLEVGGDSDACRLFGHHQIIRNNYFHDCLSEEQAGDPHIDAFQTFSVNPANQWANNILVEGNDCSRFGQMLMSEDSSESNGTGNAIHHFTFRNNIFRNVGAYAFHVGIDYFTFVNNIVAYAKYGPISFTSGPSHHAITVNNIFYQNGSGRGIGLDAVCDYNIHYPDFTNPPRTGDVEKHSLFGVDPQFVDPQNGDFRLKPGSPAIDAGVLLSPRIDKTGLARPQGATADIGPYEFITPVLDVDEDGLVDTWEVQYFGSISDSRALPDLDVDGDGLSNLFEQTAGTLPIDSKSVLRVINQSLSELLGFTITWQSVSNKTYYIESSSTLTNWSPAGSVFSTSNSSTWTDAAPAEVKKFYRVKTQ